MSIAIVAALQSPPHALLARVSLGVGIFTCEQTYAALKAMEEDLSPLLAYFVDTAAIRLEYEGSRMNILWLIDIALVFNRKKAHRASMLKILSRYRHYPNPTHFKF